MTVFGRIIYGYKWLVGGKWWKQNENRASKYSPKDINDYKGEICDFNVEKTDDSKLRK